MANEKMTWTELRKAVAEMAGTSEQEATSFLNALVDAILVGLKEDQQVKVKGIGTFALKAMAARKSVNIATGEEFTIEGYNKLTFSAEASLKESVEKRLEAPQTVEAVKEVTADPLKKLGEQAEEIVDILADLGQAVSGGSVEVEEVQEGSEVQEVQESSEVQEKKEEVVEPAPAKVEPVSAPNVKTKKCNGICWIILLLLLLGIAGAGWYFRDTLQQWWQCMQDCQPTIEIVEEVSEVEEVLEVEELTLADQPREYVNFIGIERVGQDSRLAWIAYKYYAQKDLWVFIYEANRDIIKDPTYVRPGQHIRIPELDEKYRNLYNPELRQLVDSLAVEYLSIKR
jgi:nucleoid DNA-binding protein